MAVDGEQLAFFEDTRRLHPKWGYDLDAVPRVLCLHCHRPIGDEEYVEDTGYARFGTMLFLHKRCWDECKEMDRQRLHREGALTVHDTLSGRHWIVTGGTDGWRASDHNKIRANCLRP